jgi:hypothetical protein
MVWKSRRRLMLGPEQLALLSAVTEHDRMEGTVQENTNQRTPVVPTEGLSFMVNLFDSVSYKMVIIRMLSLHENVIEFNTKECLTDALTL